MLYLIFENISHGDFKYGHEIPKCWQLLRMLWHFWHVVCSRLQSIITYGIFHQETAPRRFGSTACTIFPHVLDLHCRCVGIKWLAWLYRSLSIWRIRFPGKQQDLQAMLETQKGETHFMENNQIVWVKKCTSDFDTQHSTLYTVEY